MNRQAIQEPVGSLVFVRWYGKTLQGEVVPDDTGNRLFASMVHVRIPVQDSSIVAVFTPSHVYASLNSVPGPSSAMDSSASGGSPVGENVTQATKPAEKTVSEAWQAIQKFKEDHWDQERNHLRIDAIEEFYRLWRASVAARYGVTIEDAPTTIVAVDPGYPDGDRSAVSITPIVSKGRYQELKEQMKTKLTKKQLRSTGRIEYTDSIQTSLFD